MKEEKKLTPLDELINPGKNYKEYLEEEKRYKGARIRIFVAEQRKVLLSTGR